MSLFSKRTIAFLSPELGRLAQIGLTVMAVLGEHRRTFADTSSARLPGGILDLVSGGSKVEPDWGTLAAAVVPAGLWQIASFTYHQPFDVFVSLNAIVQTIRFVRAVLRELSSLKNAL